MGTLEDSSSVFGNTLRSKSISGHIFGPASLQGKILNLNSNTLEILKPHWCGIQVLDLCVYVGIIQIVDLTLTTLDKIEHEKLVAKVWYS